jgi:hypothetical protein
MLAQQVPLHNDGKDASDRSNATGNNQLVQQKDKRAGQHKCNCNNKNKANATTATTPAQLQQGQQHQCNCFKNAHATMATMPAQPQRQGLYQRNSNKGNGANATPMLDVGHLQMYHTIVLFGGPD